MDDPVEAQAQAYNRRDLDAFTACYAEHVVVRHGDGRVLAEGREALRQQFAPLFDEVEDLHAEIVSRVRTPAWVVDEERVTMRGRQQHAVVGYRVRDGLIADVVMLTA